LNRRQDVARKVTAAFSRDNRIPEYLLSCAQAAMQLDVRVPLEYIWYDAETSEHMDRPVLLDIRRSYITGAASTRRIAGLIMPTLDRLSCVPSHIEEFERRCEHVGVRYFYCNLPQASSC
jgi:hypothetical protein